MFAVNSEINNAIQFPKNPASKVNKNPKNAMIKLLNHEIRILRMPYAIPTPALSKLDAIPIKKIENKPAVLIVQSPLSHFSLHIMKMLSNCACLFHILVINAQHFFNDKQ